MAQGEEPNMGQGTTGAKDHGKNWQDLEAHLKSIKAYLKAEAKTEKDAKSLKARSILRVKNAILLLKKKNTKRT